MLAVNTRQHQNPIDIPDGHMQIVAKYITRTPSDTHWKSQGIQAYQGAAVLRACSPEVPENCTGRSNFSDLALRLPGGATLALTPEQSARLGLRGF